MNRRYNLCISTSLKENAITYFNEFQFTSWQDYLEKVEKGYRRWNDEIRQDSLEKMIYEDDKIKLKIDLRTVKGYITSFHENEGARILDKIRTNTLLLVSTLPAQANGVRGLAVDRITNPKIKPIFINDTTHDLYVDNPDLMGEVIVDWLSEK